MTDCELLEKAAKAAGLAHKWQAALSGMYCVIDGGRMDGPWNPLTDDGDALRLAVKLGIEVVPQSVWIWASHPSQREIIKEPPGADPCAATRRAIVRAAAAIRGSS